MLERNKGAFGRQSSTTRIVKKKKKKKKPLDLKKYFGQHQTRCYNSEGLLLICSVSDLTVDFDDCVQ